MERCLFVYNPQSGRGKIAKNEKMIVSMLSKRYDVEVARSEYVGHIEKIILNTNDIDLLVVAGGDGTLNETVNALMHLEKRPKLAYIPSGIVYDVAHSLEIKKNINKAIKNILLGQEFKHDVFKMNDRYGIYVCCAGLFTETSYATSQVQKRKMGRIAYAFHGVKKIFSTPAVKLKINYDGGEIEDKFALMLILNSRSVAGFMINRKARLNDGFVDVVLVKSKKDRVGFGAVCHVAMFFLKGLRKRSSKHTTVLRLDKFKVVTNDETIINLDGEKIGAGSFEFSVKKEALNIIVPNIKKLIK